MVFKIAYFFDMVYEFSNIKRPLELNNADLLSF